MNSDPKRFEPITEPSMTRGVSLYCGDSHIDNLNLNGLKLKAMDTASGYAWDSETCEEIADMYRAFLFLCKTYPDEVIVPPREVDEFWHLHILDTRKYHLDCQVIFGYYLHHFPSDGLLHGQDETHKQNTMRLIAQHFPSLLEEPEDATASEIA